MAKIATAPIATRMGIFRSAAMAMPRMRTEKAMPSSMEVSPTLSQPSTPPRAITVTKVAGTVQMARPPIWALRMPTLTIARKWSTPSTGWARPAMKEP